MDSLNSIDISNEFLSLLDALGIEGEKKQAFLSLPQEQKISMINAQKRVTKVTGSEIVKKIRTAKRPFTTSYTIKDIDTCIDTLNALRLSITTLVEKEIEKATEEGFTEEAWSLITLLSPSEWSTTSKTYLSIHDSKQNKPIYKILEPAVKLFKTLLKSPAVIRYIKRKEKVFQSIFEVYPSQYTDISLVVLDTAVKCMDVHMQVVLQHLFSRKDKTEEHVQCVPLCSIRLKYIMDELYYNLSLNNVPEEYIVLVIELFMHFYKESPLVGIMMDSMLRYGNIAKILSKMKQKDAQVKHAVDGLIEQQERIREIAEKMQVQEIETGISQESQEDIKIITNIVGVLCRINSSRVYDVLHYIRSQVLEEVRYKNIDSKKIEQEKILREEHTKKTEIKCICEGLKDLSMTHKESPANIPITIDHALEASPAQQHRSDTDHERNTSTIEVSKTVAVAPPAPPKAVAAPPPAIPKVPAPPKFAKVPSAPQAPPAIPKVPAPPKFSKAPPAPPILPKTIPTAPSKVPSIPKGVPPTLPKLPPKAPMNGSGDSPAKSITGSLTSSGTTSMGKVPPVMPNIPGTSQTPGPRAQYIKEAVKLHPSNPQKIPFEVHIRKPTVPGLWSQLNRKELEVFTKEDFKIFERNATDKPNETQKKPTENRILDPKRCKAIDIILARVKTPYKDLIHGVDSLNRTLFTETLIGGLLANYPTEDELDQIRTTKVTLAPEVFYKMAIEVPHFKDKLVALHLTITSPNIKTVTIPNIERLVKGCTVLLTNTAVHQLMQITLGVVNILNAGERTEGAWGVRIESLPRILDCEKVAQLIHNKVKHLKLDLQQPVEVLKDSIKVSSDLIKSDCEEYQNKKEYINSADLKEEQLSIIQDTLILLEVLQTEYQRWTNITEQLKAFYGEKEMTGTAILTLSKYIISIWQGSFLQKKGRKA